MKSVHCICNKETNEMLIIHTNHQTIVQYFKDYKVGPEKKERQAACELNQCCFIRGFYNAT